LFDKCIAVLHFSWSYPSWSIESYFVNKKRQANSSLGIDRKGKTVRYLKNILNPAWTQGVSNWRKNVGFINYEGKRIKNVNNIAVSFELENVNYQPFTEIQYEQTAIRLLWMLNRFENFRLWLVTGHEQIIPIKKDDVGVSFNWKKLFVEYCGVRKDFYDEYLIYLANTSSRSTVGDKQRSFRKWEEIYEGVEKIRNDLIGMPKSYCF